MDTLHWTDCDRLFISDSGRWGRGYGGEPFTTEELEETRKYITERMRLGGGLDGYQNRGLIAQAPGFMAREGECILPPGFDAEHPSRLTVTDPMLIEPNNPTSLDCLWRVPASLEQFYRATGAPVDQHGRWVHPLGLQVMEAGIYLCTGYGLGYEGGETIVVDTVVDDGECVLLTTRKEDDGRIIPSLVGGYTWGTDYTTIENWRVGNRPITLEGVYKAVRRIIRSKAGIELPQDAEFEIVWGIRPWSSVHTLHFGTLTYTVRIRLDSGGARHMVPSGDAYWQPKRDISSVVDDLWPDHRRGYDAAMV